MSDFLRLSGACLWIALLVFTRTVSASAGESPEKRFVSALLELARPLLEGGSAFHYRLKASVFPPKAILEPRVQERTGEKGEKAFSLELWRSGFHDGGLLLQSPWRDVLIRRNVRETSLTISQSGVTFQGSGMPATSTDSLEPEGLLSRLIVPETQIFSFLAVAGPATFERGVRNLLLPRLVFLPGETADLVWKTSGGNVIRLNAAGTPRLRVEINGSSGLFSDFHFFELTLKSEGEIPKQPFPRSTLVSKVDRATLEKLIFRGIRRILTLKFPAEDVFLPPASLKVPHGELRRRNGQTLVLLFGSPEEIGTAHAELLEKSYRQTVDSTIYLIGLVETISNGKWFLRELEEAWERLSPHVPDDHLRELRAMASASRDVSYRETCLVNVFPEYFHCSGFAAFGKATTDGTLYQGRVLDYMSAIGLQQMAVMFAVKPKGKFAFLNVGFAGFIGSVTGMNEKQISLGEMGGGGRYKWDGVPMATLMRRALEECSTLEEVKSLWKSNPRTCEYYYVFADGKIPNAVAVRAVPEEIEFLEPGSSHPKLGEGIPDSLVISGGSRLKTLRERVIAAAGKITASAALHFMDRPVAMTSNLHNVLFIPQRLEAYVAIAGDSEPAVDRPYIRYDFKDILRQFPRP